MQGLKLKISLPKPMPFSIGGVMKAMTKLLETWLVPNKNDVRILELYYLLHPVRACTNRCSCNTTSVLRDLTAIERRLASNIPFDLIDNGKISAIRVQLTGPIPYAKLAISVAGQPSCVRHYVRNQNLQSHTNTTATQPATACLSQS